MKQKDLIHYRKLYQTAQRMGAAKLLIDFLGLEHDSIVPLSVAHGVDIGQLHEPIDIWRPEPIHWSYNHALHLQAERHKPSLLLPHPWAIETSLAVRNPPYSSGTLIIGPPPSPNNDQALFDILSPEINSTWTILLKQNRGNAHDSYKFWQEKGVKIVSAGGEDDHFYSRLNAILSRYDSIVGCTFSSAVVFAASIGKEVHLLEDYTYRVYDFPRYVNGLNLASSQAKNTISIFLNKEKSEVTDHARELLGFDLIESKEALKKKYEDMINTTTALFHPIRSTPMLTTILAEIALWLDRPGALKTTPKLLLEETLNRKLVAKEINEISCWINGPSATNYRTMPIKYKRRKTRGGMGF